MFKFAVKSKDLGSLVQWNNTQSSKSELSQQDFYSLRQILSEILLNIKRIGNLIFSSIVDQDMRAGTNLVSSIADIENFPAIKIEIQKTMDILSKLQPQTSDYSHRYFNSSIATNILQNICHSILSSQFSQQDIQKLEEIKRMVTTGKSTKAYRGMDDRAKIEALNTSGIYGSNDRGNVKIAIREVLQNAVDAVLKAKKMKPDLQPTITVQTQAYDIQGKTYFDFLLEDNGVGMDMTTLYDKFLSAGGSGKENDPAATGGFGIAKRSIQNTPLDYWSVDTNDLHVNKFQSEMYKTTLADQQFLPPKAKVSKNGTSILLARLIYIDAGEIQKLCSYYSTNGVKIIFNGEVVPPYIDTSKVKKIKDTNSLLDIIASSDLERVRSQKVLEEDVKTNGPLAEDMNFPHVKITFSAKPIERFEGGKMLVLLNGQFQFSKEDFYPVLQKVDIICSITTDAKPYVDKFDANGDRQVTMNQDYPVTPSRNSFNTKYEQQVMTQVNRISEVISKAGKNILKEGKNVKFLNKHKKSKSIRQILGREDIDETGSAIKDLTMDYLKTDSGFERERILQNIVRSKSSPEPGTESVSVPIDANQIKMLRSILDAELLGNKAVQQLLMSGNVTAINQRIDETINKMDALLDAKCAFVVENEFISPASFSNMEGNIPNTLVMWEAVLEVLLKEFARVGILGYNVDSTFSPGIVFSKECLAMHQRLEGGESIIAVNPVSLAKLILPEDFDKFISRVPGQQDYSTEEMGFMHGLKEKQFQDMMPVERVANRMFHLAIHELTHFLHPEADEEYKDFHRNISIYQMVGEKVKDEVYAAVKETLKPVREEMKNIIRILSRDEFFKQHLKTAKFLRKIKIARKRNWYKNKILL